MLISMKMGLGKANSANEYNVLLKKAKLNMIKQGLHPYYWAAFIINGE